MYFSSHPIRLASDMFGRRIPFYRGGSVARIAMHDTVFPVRLTYDKTGGRVARDFGRAFRGISVTNAPAAVFLVYCSVFQRSTADECRTIFPVCPAMAAVFVPEEFSRGIVPYRMGGSLLRIAVSPTVPEIDLLKKHTGVQIEMLNPLSVHRSMAWVAMKKTLAIRGITGARTLLVSSLRHCGQASNIGSTALIFVFLGPSAAAVEQKSLYCSPPGLEPSVIAFGRYPIRVGVLPSFL
jgi:hypothetical protein